MKGNEVGDSLVGESALVGSRKTAYGSAIDWRGASQDLFWFRGLAGLFRQEMRMLRRKNETTARHGHTGNYSGSYLPSIRNYPEPST